MANPNQEIKYTKIFINNEFVDAVSGKTFAAINPSTEKKLADIAEGDKADVDKAVAAAKVAFARGSVWRNMDASARGKLIYKLADLVERDAAIIASIEALDNGKTFPNAYGDTIYSAMTIRHSAGWCDKIFGNTIPTDGPFLSFTRKEPIGVVGQIIPWNYPMLMLAMKWGPALAAGCTIVLKPAEQTPLTALYMAALSKEAGFPPGVINVVPGYGHTAGAAISLHPDIRKVAFTGSVEVGRIVSQDAAKSNLKKVSLELGGKSPLVIFDDYDVDEAVKIAHEASFINHGQNCCAGSRTFVQEGIYDSFVAKSAELAKTRKLGDAFSADAVQGPQVDDKQLNTVLGYIESAKKEGATLVAGGQRHGKVGYFVEPTVFANVTDDMKIAREEIFGPVQSIFKFKTIDEVIERANNTEFGLASGVLSKNINNVLVFAQAVEAGNVWANCYGAFQLAAPFGGYKQSGHGRENTIDGVELYLETKTVTIQVPAKN